MELQMHISVPKSYADTFEETMQERFAMGAADAETGLPIHPNGLTLEEQAEKIFWYVVETEGMATSQIQARVTDLQSFLRERQISGLVREIEFETDEEEALRLLSSSLAWAHTVYVDTQMLPVFAIITAIADPFEEEIGEDAHQFSSPPQSAIPVQLSVFLLNDISGRFPMSHMLLRPEHVPPLVSDWWRRMLYSHYVTLSLRQERLALLVDPQSKRERTRIQALLAIWETWFSQQAQTNQMFAVQEMHLSLLTAASGKDTKTRPGASLTDPCNVSLRLS